MKTGSAKIPIALALLVAIAAIVVSAVSIKDANTLKHGISEGFRLDGVYRDHETGLTQLSFLGEDENRWQIVDSNGNVTDGSFETTGDPNIFMLADHQEMITDLSTWLTPPQTETKEAFI